MLPRLGSASSWTFSPAQRCTYVQPVLPDSANAADSKRHLTPHQATKPPDPQTCTRHMSLHACARQSISLHACGRHIHVTTCIRHQLPTCHHMSSGHVMYNMSNLPFVIHEEFPPGHGSGLYLEPLPHGCQVSPHVGRHMQRPQPLLESLYTVPA